MSDYSSNAAATLTVPAVECGRRIYRHKQTVRSILISLTSTIVVAGVLIAVVVNSGGWEVTRNAFFNGRYFVEVSPQVFSSLWPNIRILPISVLSVAVFATLLAAARTLTSPVFFPIRFLATAYTDTFRGVSFLVVLYLIGFGIPALNPTTRIPTASLGTVALILTYSSYVAEVLCASLDSVHPSQRCATHSLDLSHGQTLRMVVIPRVIRRATPVLMNNFISIQKDVGLISALGAVDAIRSAQMVQAKTYDMTSYVVADLLFIILLLPFVRLSDWYTARLRERKQMGGIA